MIRDAENKELIIVSLFLLPILLGAWSLFLNSIAFLNQYDSWKFEAICVLLAMYIIGLALMKLTDTQKDKLKRARYHVETRLKKRPGHLASFDAIRREVDETYTDDFLKKLIDLNPELFGRCEIKRKDDNKPGITLVKIESDKYWITN